MRKSSKWLRVEMPDGSLWDVPCYVIAQNYAEYYSEKTDSYSKTYDEIMEYDQLLIEWAENDIDWEDIERYAILTKPGSTDFQKGWINGQKKIIEY